MNLNLKKLGLYKCNWTGYEKVIKRIDNNHTILTKNNGKWIWYNKKEICEDSRKVISNYFNLPEEKYQTYKTLINSNGEFGIIDIDHNSKKELIIGTSSTPNLYGKEINLDDLKNQFNNKGFKTINDTQNTCNFFWDTHIPKDWKLVKIHLNCIY